MVSAVKNILRGNRVERNCVKTVVVLVRESFYLKKNYAENAQAETRMMRPAQPLGRMKNIPAEQKNGRKYKKYFRQGEGQNKKMV